MNRLRLRLVLVWPSQKYKDCVEQMRVHQMFRTYRTTIIANGSCPSPCALPTSCPLCGCQVGAAHAPQAAYKQELSESHGITFNSLLCLNNMPIKRYVDYLQRRGQLQEYMQVLLPCACLCPARLHSAMYPGALLQRCSGVEQYVREMCTVSSDCCLPLYYHSVRVHIYSQEPAGAPASVQHPGLMERAGVSTLSAVWLDR